MRPDHTPPAPNPNVADVVLPRQPSRADRTTIEALLATARKAGAIFMERVSDGELVVESLDRLAPDDHQKLQARWGDACKELLPNDTTVASLTLLGELGIELVHIDTEERAAAEVQRICGASTTLGLDIE